LVNADRSLSAEIGFIKYSKAPNSYPTFLSPIIEISITGISLVTGFSFRALRILQPSLLGKSRSKVIANGCFSWASFNPVSPSSA